MSVAAMSGSRLNDQADNLNRLAQRRHVFLQAKQHISFLMTIP
jgi:hypothetical protein